MCVVQIHQPITFNNFEHQLITDKWAERVASAENVHNVEITTLHLPIYFQASAYGNK